MQKKKKEKNPDSEQTSAGTRLKWHTQAPCSMLMSNGLLDYEAFLYIFKATIR